MKKLILAILVGTSLSGCVIDSSDFKRLAGVPPTFTEQDFIGSWYCESSYSTWGVVTKEYMHYKPNGIVDNEGEMTITNPKGAGELKYKYSVRAKWHLDGWNMVQTQTSKPKYKRMIDAENLALLKKDKEFQEIATGVEKIMFNTQNSASRAIASVTPTEYTTKVQTSYEICSRVK